MKKITTRNALLRPGKTSLALFAFFVLSTACHKSIEPKALRDFEQVNLVANTAAYGAMRTDATLQNAWGLAFSSGGTPWVNSLGGHVSEVFDKDGGIVRPAVRIPSPTDTINGLPTGVVFSNGKGFKIATGGTAFLFAGVDGVISGWNGGAGANAKRIKDNSSSASYTGLALASVGTANYLYAADFRGGKIAVWDTNFVVKTNMPFHDPSIPKGFSPFNIQLVGSWLFVTYAKVGPDGRDQAGAGEGFVSVFNTDGSFVKRFASRGWLNAPWGVTQAAPGFFIDNTDKDDGGHDGYNSGKGSSHSGKDDVSDSDPTILVGNFGDGHINAYSMDGKFLGQMQSHKRPIVIYGLWALTFAPSTATTIDPNRLYFTAGPNDEKDGLFGYLIKQ